MAKQNLRTYLEEILSRFDGWDQELLNLKDVIIRDIQVENQGVVLLKGVDTLMHIMTRVNVNHLKQYGKRNNLEFTGIPDDVSDKNLEEKVI